MAFFSRLFHLAFYGAAARQAAGSGAPPVSRPHVGPPEGPSGAYTPTRDFHILHIRYRVRIADRQTLGHAVSNRDRHGGGGGQESFLGESTS